jgi:ribose transport system substrate-binding protein
MAPTRFVFLLALLCAVGIGCGRSANRSSQSKGTKPGTRVWKIAVIPKGTTHVFWKSVHAGAARAAREAGNVEIFWKGPMQENDREGQINVVQDFITKQVDGICLAPLDSQALIGSVRDAKEEGIPTVIYDSGLDDASLAVSYVATDNRHGGALAARRLADRLKQEGDVILLRYNQGSESTLQREEGFLETIEKEFPKLNILSSDQYAGTTPRKALTVAEQMLIKYRDRVDGIFAVCEPNSTGVHGALENQELAGKVKFIDFDPTPKLIHGMSEGSVDGIVLQDPVNMGYLAVKTMVAHLNGEKVDSRVDTGDYIATPESQDEPRMHELLHPEQFHE